MKNIELNYSQSGGVDENTLKELNKQLQPEIERLQNAVGTGYDTPLAFVNLPDDQTMRSLVQDVVEKKQALKPAAIVVVGIGGSNLGTVALQEALLGTLSNELGSPRIFYADTVDTDYLSQIIKIIEQLLNQGEHVFINVVTKSGRTTETIANFEIFLAVLMRYHPDDYHKYVVVTTDEGSPLWAIAQDKHFDCLHIPKQVGGRFSVFSPVGLFPLGMLNVDLVELLNGARVMRDQCTNREYEKNYAALSALLKYAHFKNGIEINDFFVFAVASESVGKWYRQLMGESLGKTTQQSKEKVGITPTVSVGSIDLHSVGQLYLGGPNARFTTFLTIEQQKTNLSVPDFNQFEQCVASIQGKPLSLIMAAIEKGTKLAYQKAHLPFGSVSIPELSAYALGQLLQMYMMEIVYLGYLLDVNPFDQPQVELYKSETRKLLNQ